MSTLQIVSLATSTTELLCDVKNCAGRALYRRTTNGQIACADHALPHDLKRCWVQYGSYGREFAWSGDKPVYGTWELLVSRLP